MTGKWLVGGAVVLMVLAFAVAGAVTFGLALSAASSAGSASGSASSHLSPAVSPTFTLSTSSGPVGTAVEVSGTGWVPGDTVLLYFGGAFTAPCGGVVVQPSGDFPSDCEFNVPQVPGGASNPWSVDADDMSTSTTVYASPGFQITASLTLSPDHGVVGSTVTASGTGYDASSAMSFTWDGAPLTTSSCSSDTTGSFSGCTFTVPTGPVGVYQVQGTDASSTAATADFTVSPDIFLSAYSGPVGTSVAVTGTGYHASSAITITFNGVTMTTSPSPCDSDSAGSFGPCTFTVPVIPNGAYDVQAEDSHSNFEFTTFDVTASLSLSPSTGVVGTVVTATGTGFAASSAITMYFDGTAVPAACTLNDGTGTFTCTFTVPAAPNGANTVTARDTAGDSATATFTVNASLSVSPTSGIVGSTFTGTGNGFAASSTITFTLDGYAATSTCASNPAGSFTCAVTVPPAPNGLETVVATDGSNSATNTYAVENSISLSPTSGPPGTSVTVSGNGFGVSSTITIFFDGASQTTTPSPCMTLADGSFSCSFNVPVVPYGAYTVAADGIPATATFTVTAAVTTLSPSSGDVGTVVDASGDGFAASSPISFTFDGIALVTSCTTNSAGAFSACAFTVPPAPHGAETVVAKDGSGNSADATFTVLASLTLSPTSGAVGSWVSASGLGYAASSAITLSFNGVTVATSPSPCDTSSAGSFTCSFQVPANPLGTYTVTAKDGSSNSASATYKVTTSLMLSPTSGAVGSTVTATGNGYAASSTVTITFNDVVVTTSPSPCMTNSAGSFSCTFVVPQAPHGPEVVVAKDASSNTASTTFSVTSKITLSPTSGPGKTIVTVTGTGFAASATITIYFNGDKMTTTPSTCKSNTVGSFSCTFKVPEGKNATHTVEAKDTLGDTATASFKRT